jgi:anaerobic magnesium-protoporphyrin IX monomethyl ester cyclase
VDFLFSVYSSNLAISLITAQIIKRKTSRPVIFGGPGVGISEIYRFLLKTGFVDGIVVGEGEETIVDVIKTQDFLNSSSSIHGYVTNSSLDRYVPRHLITDIDSIPYPVFDDFPAKGYNLRAYLLSGKTTFIPISTSRGCVMKCSFCSENKYWQKFRLRSVESITDEILYQTKKYKINNINHTISEICDHEFIEDEIEICINENRLQKINYCKICEYTREYGFYKLI